MYLKLIPGKLSELAYLAVSKAGSERKLCFLLNLSKGKLYRYKKELVNISDFDLLKLSNFLNLPSSSFNPYIIEKLSPNWGKVKGGLNCVISKKENGTFQASLQLLKQNSSSYMKEWHRFMKEKFPKEYYLSQYERFKKIKPGYTYPLTNGILVRNKLEQEIGNFLIQKYTDLEYEPYMNINSKVYFPDFKIKNLIIEVTAWRHPSPTKLLRLKTKLSNYQNMGFLPFLFVPKACRKFYKELQSFIISELEELKNLPS